MNHQLQTFTSVSPEVTEVLGKRLAPKLRGQKVFLFGELGIGKTTFLRGLARGLKVKTKIKSPTFVGEHLHKISARETLAHLDLYRKKTLSVEASERMLELIQDPKVTLVVEWSEYLPKKFLPKKRVEIRFLDEGKEWREIVMNKIGEE